MTLTVSPALDVSRRGAALEEAARTAVAAGAAALATSGSELCRREDVERLQPRVEFERVA